MFFSSFSLRVAAGGALLLSTNLLTTGCKQVCGDNLPQYSLSAGQRAWGDSYVVNTVWRFRNPAGYERSYRVSSFDTDLTGSGGSKSSFCPSYYREYAFADFVRTDSVFAGAGKGDYRLQLTATLPDGSVRHFQQWHGRLFNLPIDEVEAGQLVLSSATFGGRTYANVLECTNTDYSSRTLHLYLTKADGVVAFDDRYGTLWARQ